LKTIRVSSEIYRKLALLLGEQKDKTGDSQTFNVVIDDLISKNEYSLKKQS